MFIDSKEKAARLHSVAKLIEEMYMTNETEIDVGDATITTRGYDFSGVVEPRTCDPWDDNNPEPPPPGAPGPRGCNGF